MVLRLVVLTQITVAAAGLLALLHMMVGKREGHDALSLRPADARRGCEKQ